MDITVSNILLLRSVRPNLSQKEFDDIKLLSKSNVHWEIFLNNAIQNRLSSIVYKTFSNSNILENIPKHIFDNLQKYYYKTLSKNTVLYSYFTLFLQECYNKDIQVVALKGIFLADNVYGDIGIRQLSDIDLLVHEKDANNCAEILIQMGFVFDNSLIKSDFIKSNKESKHLPMLVKDGVGVEIHTNIIISNQKFHIPIEDFWDNTEKHNVAGIDILAFNANYLLLHICMHLDEHFEDAKIHFIAYIDILWILETYKTTLDWNKFDKMCEQYRCTSDVYSHLYICHKYFNANISDSIKPKIESYCDEYTEEYFIQQLQCNTNYSAKKKNRNISELKRIKGLRNKLRFLIDDMFPSKLFMYKRYSINNPRTVYWYYIVRQIDGIISLVKYIFRIKHI